MQLLDAWNSGNFSLYGRALFRAFNLLCYAYLMSDDSPDRNQAESADRAASVPLESEKAESLVVGGFTFAKKLLLFITAIMTLTAVAIEVWTVIDARNVDLADILLMFLYTEVIAMVAVFYTNRGSPFIYPILIAITALARLIVLQGKDMSPQNILYEAAAIVLLTFAIVMLIRFPLQVGESSD